MKDRRKVHGDAPWWLDKNPNFARLQMAVTRGAVIFGKDHVRILKNFKQKEDIQNGQSNPS